MDAVHTLELLLALLTAAVLLAVVARRLLIPPAAAYTIGGLGLAITPGVPPFEMEPALILTLFLPPLLQGSAFFTNWHMFRANLRPILLLAVGCVTFTTVVVGVVAHALVPDLPWAACFVMGAIVSPPDAVAASAVLSRLRLPRRLVVVLEGESLINDATGLVLYRFGVAAALGGLFEPWRALGSFVLVAAGGLGVGIGCGSALVWATRRLADTHLEIAASFIVAWTSYIAAETLGLSGVLSTVACGLILGQRQHQAYTPRTRIEARAAWSFVTFVLEALVFVLIGLSLHGVLSRLGSRAGGLLPLAGWIVLAVTLARVAWVYPATYLARLIPAIRRNDPAPPLAFTAIVAWAGMRGVVSLAAVLALPEAFPGRDVVLFATFAVIVVTVLVQGTTLGPLIRWLGIAEPLDGERGTEADIRAALAAEEMRVLEARADDPLAEARIMASWATAGTAGGAALAELQARLAIKLEATEARRTTLFALDRERHLPDTLLHALEHEIDLEELRLRRRLEPAG